MSDEQQSAAVEESSDLQQQARDLSITFAFSGANMGGQSLSVCMGKDGCGALVQEAHEARHLNWHVMERP